MDEDKLKITVDRMIAILDKMIALVDKEKENKKVKK